MEMFLWYLLVVLSSITAICVGVFFGIMLKLSCDGAFHYTNWLDDLLDDEEDENDED